MYLFCSFRHDLDLGTVLPMKYSVRKSIEYKHMNWDLFVEMLGCLGIILTFSLALDVINISIQVTILVTIIAFLSFLNLLSSMSLVEQQVT